MDLAKVLSQLRAELQNLNVAIASLEKLAAQRPAHPEPSAEPKRPGRPRKNPDSIATEITVQKRK